MFGVENSLKALKGRFTALVDPKIIAQKAKAEKALRAAVESDPKLRAADGGAGTASPRPWSVSVTAAIVMC